MSVATILVLIAVGAVNLFLAVYTPMRDGHSDIFDVLGILLAGCLFTLATIGILERRKK